MFIRKAALLTAFALSFQIFVAGSTPVLADDAPEAPAAPLQGGVEMSQAETNAYNAAASKLHSSAKMDADDFRALQIGVTGIELTRNTGDEYSKVEAVFKGMPAEAAGIKEGELVVAGEPGKEASEQIMASMQGRPAWTFTGGKAGSIITLKVLRHGEIVPVTITRMNIEDIPDTNMRKMYEKMARRLGPSGEGTTAVSEPGHHVPMLLKVLGHL